VKGSLISQPDDRELWTQQLILMEMKSAEGRRKTFERYTCNKCFENLQQSREKNP